LQVHVNLIYWSETKLTFY